MKKFLPIVFIRSFRRLKLSFGICVLFYFIFMINGYLKAGVYNENFEDSDDVFEAEANQDNRRHNRNLQHLYPEEIKSEKRNLKSKTNLDYIKTPIIQRENKLQLGGNGAKDDLDLVLNERRNDHITKRLPQAIIIGVKKGGTRALLEFLRAHPKVKATGPEPHFFDKNYEKGLDWYRDLMPESDGSQMTIEKTPGYFITRDVPKRVYNMSSDVKLVVVVRNPVTRAISDYAQIATKSSKPQSFENMIFRSYNASIIDTSKTIVKIGMYAKHLERWLKYFPLHQIHFVNGENLVTEPGTELVKIQKFLNLPVLINRENFSVNQSRGFPCIRRRLNKKPHCLDETKGRKHPYINPRSISSLKEFYRPLNRRFSRLIGQSFDWS